MDSKDNKKDDDGMPKLPPLERPTNFTADEEQTQLISQNRYATTQSVAESLMRVRSEFGQGQEKQKSSITLNILGIDTPITFRDKALITLGRKNPATNEHPDVDLSGLPLNTAGISRKHVNLVYSNGQWYVEDLGSRNGTWLNSKLLMAYQRYKLNDGDQLRTGGISIIVLTHAEDKSNDPIEMPSKSTSPDQLTLTTSAILENQRGLDISYMTHHLMPYLRAVIEMIQHVDRAKKRPQREISIVSIEFSYPTITARLTYAHEILRFMTVQPLVKKISESSGTVTEVLTPETSSVDIDNQSIELARQFAEEYFPLIASDQSQHYQRLLAPLLKVCIESDIRVVMKAI